MKEIIVSTGEVQTSTHIVQIDFEVTYNLENYVSCFPSCDAFKCGQHALIHAGKRIYCRWADDDCVGCTCNYAICVRGRLLPNGVCGLSVKRKTNEESAPETVNAVSAKLNTVKVKGKLLRRFREDDLI